MKIHENAPSLEEVHSSIDATGKTGIWRKLFAFMGPAYLVSVGYMDPGNWATDIAGGSKFGYALIWVLIMSNIMALLLQSLSARLGIVRGLDLAQACRQSYSRSANFILWLMAEVAIAACDLAEVIGMAIGLNLLFNLNLLTGVSLTVLDTILLVFLIRFGMRKMEAFIIALIGVIGVAFFIQMVYARPEIGAIAQGIIPSLPGPSALYIAIGIIGATVMPHNLYLHSSLVQTRKIERTTTGIFSAIKYNFIDSAIALNLALFVNAAILILAAATFFKNGYTEVAEIQDAHKLLAPLLGTKLAPILFAVALIAAGQSSTLTGTLSGQIIMEGYLNLRIQPWIRRLITRAIAIIPALITINYFGEGATGKLLILSQVILSLQLGFAIVPLIHFTSDKKTMGKFATKPWMAIAAWICASIIIFLNAKLIYDNIVGWLSTPGNNLLIYLLVIPVTVAAALFLLYIIFRPFIRGSRERKTLPPHGLTHQLIIAEPRSYKKIAITIDFSRTDNLAINHAISQGGTGAQYILIHTLETAGARMMNNEIADHESTSDQANLEKYVSMLLEKNYSAKATLGYGNPKISIPEIVNQEDIDLLVMGAHGHKAIKDLILGTTIETVRHKIKIPVLIVRE